MDKKKIKLLHVVLEMDVGGLQRFVYEMSLLMHGEKYDIEVLCLNRLGSFADALIKKGIPVTLLQKNQTRTDFSYPWKLKKFLKEKHFDIIQMHSGTFLYGSVAAKLAKTKAVVYTDHGRALEETRMCIMEEQFASRFVDKIIAVSNELKEHLINVVGLPQEKTGTIINGINVENFSVREKPEYLLQEFNFKQEDKIIGTTGRLDDVKDHKTLIKSFQKVLEKTPNVYLMIVGEGHLKEELDVLVENKKLKDKIIFTGNRKDIPELLNLFDVFVLSSLSEGTSLSLLEAMASGLPAVVTNVGGNTALIKHEVNGLVVEPKNIEQISDSIIEILSDSDKYEKFRKNTLLHVHQNYSISSMIEKYEKEYNRILDSKK